MGERWDEDPEWPMSEWVLDVVQGNTRLGYWAWVDHNREEAEERDEHEDDWWDEMTLGVGG